MVVLLCPASKMSEESMSKMDLKGTDNDEPNPSEVLSEA